MAEHEHHSADNSQSAGNMDIADKVRTWQAFWSGAKWSVVGIIIIVGFLAIFRTHNGY